MGVQYFESAVRTPAAASGATIATLHTGANLRCYITEIGLGISAGTQTQVGIIRPNNTPVASTSQLGQALDPQSAASTVNLDSAWSTAPTIGSNVYLRRFQLPASACCQLPAASCQLPAGNSRLHLNRLQSMWYLRTL